LIYDRKTLKSDAIFEGVGLHSGEPVRVVVRPSDSGIQFRRGATTTPARPENVTDTTRCTRLGEVSTIEHLMSAFCGLEITDADVEVQGIEMPGLDGSATGFVSGLTAAGFENIGEAEVGTPFSRVFIQEENVKIAIGRGSGHWRYVFEVPNRWPGEQAFDQEDIAAEYASEVAPARTFALAEEVPAILQAGLAKGLDDQSALILGIEGYKNDARFENEPARHKLLDLLGDLYLAGVPAKFLNVVAERSGHASNVRAAGLLAEAVRPRA
jgi:UDP-3-O-[3-hydroxymyristoyl] N-acetylglucosamine deacetylase